MSRAPVYRAGDPAALWQSVKGLGERLRELEEHEKAAHAAIAKLANTLGLSDRIVGKGSPAERIDRIRNAIRNTPEARALRSEDGKTGARDMQRVTEALRELAGQHRPGTLLHVRDLRAQVGGLEKERFDTAVLALAAERRAVLHHHDHPMSLSEEERDELVHSPHGSAAGYKGTYYIGIAPRAGER